MSIAAEIARLAQGAYGSGLTQTRILCPECSASRSSAATRNERCMAVQIDHERAVYKCHHCGIDGIVPFRDRHERRPDPKPIVLHDTFLSAEALSWLSSRGITEEVARANGLFSDVKRFRRLNRESACIGFPYIDETGKIEAVKYRAFPIKDFTQQGSASTFWGFEKALNTDPGTLLIVEGEMDKLTAEVVPMGMTVLGVPNGAMQTVTNGKIDPSEDKKFQYIWRAKDILDKATKIILAVDGDDAGRVLGEELARRIGKDRCWRATYPEGTKDLNDVFKTGGVSGVRALLEGVEQWPVAGLNRPEYYGAQVEDFYNNGLGKGHSTGLWSVDALFTLWPGIYVVTGIPGSGKSEFIDQITFNTAMESSWKWALCSFENPPPLHIAKLAEKKIQKPFHIGPTERMTMEELREARGWIDDHYGFIDLNDGQPPTIEVILDRAMGAVRRLGVRGVVIDPYNHIQRPGDMNETVYVNDMLQKTRAFQKATETVVFLVAHPQKLMSIDGKPRAAPTGYDISGSSHWFNHADCGLTAHRPSAETTNAEIYCWKARFKWMGRQGKTTINYSTLTGSYTDRGLDEHDPQASPIAPPQASPITAPWD